MSKIRFLLSVWACKAVIFISKFTSKSGSSAPGQIALKICPDALKIAAAQVKEKIIVTCGTNGKTTTNNLINNVLKVKYKTVCNTVGANMTPGIATAFLEKTSLFGKLDCDYAVLEVDEAYSVKVFDHFKPDVIHITNLLRDQLDRYGEIDGTEKYLIDAINKSGGASLVINADDPICYGISLKTGAKTTTYSIDENVGFDLTDTKDGRYCKKCGKELSYNYYHYSQLGDYYCSCGFKRPDADYRATALLYKTSIQFDINGNYTVSADYRGFYNIYNMLSCYAVLDSIGIDMSDYNELLKSFRPQFGRMEKFSLNKPAILNLAKNPAGFNQAVQAVVSDDNIKDIIIALNDNPSDGIDVSWLWDVDFEKFADEKVNTIAVTGIRKDELNVRLKYADINKKITVYESLEEAVTDILEENGEELYLLVNYTVIFEADKLMRKLEKKYNGN